MAAAPDDPALVYAAGGSAVGISEDGGINWRESVPQTNRNDNVWHVVVGPTEGTSRRIYTVGSHVWYSSDNGNSWRQDPGQQSLGFPADGPGASSRALGIHPTDPAVIYLNNGGMLWRGDFSTFDNSGAATWTQLPSIPIGYAGTTASGGDYIVPHVDPAGDFYLFATDRRTANVSKGEPASALDWKRIDAGIHVDPHGLALTPGFEMPPASNFMPIPLGDNPSGLDAVDFSLGPYVLNIPDDIEPPPPNDDCI